MQLVSLNSSEPAAIKDMPDYDTLKSELRCTKRCIYVLSLLVAFLLLITLGMLCLTVFGFVHIDNSSTQVDQPFLDEIINNTELISQVTKKTKQIQDNVSQISAYLSDMQATALSLRYTVARLGTKANATDHDFVHLRNTLEYHLSNTDIQVANLASVKNVVTSLESRLNVTEGEITGLMLLRSSLTSVESQLNMTNIMVSSLQDNLISQPIIRLSRVVISVSGGTSVYIRFRRLNSITFAGEGISTQISISPSISNISSDNILAYRPNFYDGHGSNLATIFINLEAVYPCIIEYYHIHVSCKLFPSEDDGFRRGRAIFEAGDNGGNFRVFGTGSTTYAFALEGCTQLSSRCITNIVSPRFGMAFNLVCLLPSGRCSNT